jgi:hypothetical protein
MESDPEKFAPCAGMIHYGIAPFSSSRLVDVFERDGTGQLHRMLPLIAAALCHATSQKARNALEADNSQLLAITISGVARSLLSVPVVQSFRRYVPPGDVHIVIAGDLDKATSTRVQAVYTPIAIRTIRKFSTTMDLNATCDSMTPGPFVLNTQGTLLQFIALHEVFQDVEQTERQRGVNYDWVIKLRTDLVFFEALSIRGLDSNFVHLPSGGMSGESTSRWTNDHIFVCPRHLCRAYYELLEIVQSPFCFGNGFNFTNTYGLPPGIYATSIGGVLIPNGPPTYNYTIPSILGTRWNAAWYFLARYSVDGCLPYTTEERVADNITTCGLVHEFDIAYTLARGTETSGYLDCGYTLQAPGAWRETQHYYPRIQEAYRECGATYGSSFNYSGTGDWA